MYDMEEKLCSLEELVGVFWVILDKINRLYLCLHIPSDMKMGEEEDACVLSPNLVLDKQ